MSRRREALVGVVIVGAVLLTTVGTLWMQGARWGQYQETIEAVFFEAGQIQPGNGVKFRGVEVGRVGEITVEPNGELVRIQLQLQQRLALPDDPVVILSPESVFGDWEAEVQSRDIFPYVEYPVPPDPGTLPGYALPDISQLTATADRISENLAVLSERFGIAFSEETAQDIASLIANIENVTTGLSELVEQQAASFTEVTAGVQEATDEVASAAEQVRSTFAEVTNLLEGTEMDSTLENLSVISDNMRELSEELGDTNQEIRAMAERIHSTFRRAQAVVATLEAGDGTLGRLLQDTSMAAELESTLSELSALLEDIQENPNRYVRLSIF